MIHEGIQAIRGRGEREKEGVMGRIMNCLCCGSELEFRLPETDRIFESEEMLEALESNPHYWCRSCSKLFLKCSICSRWATEGNFRLENGQVICRRCC